MLYIRKHMYFFNKTARFHFTSHRNVLRIQDSSTYRVVYVKIMFIYSFISQNMFDIKAIEDLILSTLETI